MNRSQSSQVSRSKCSHLCQHVRARTPFSTRVGRACHAWESVSQWIINGCNVMTDDSERPVPPHPWPGCVVLVSTVRRRRRPTQSDWLILSSTLLLSLRSVRSELFCNLSQSLSAWLQSHRASPSVLIESRPIVRHFLQFILCSSPIKRAYLSCPIRSFKTLLLQRHIINPGLFTATTEEAQIKKNYLLTQIFFDTYDATSYYLYGKFRTRKNSHNFSFNLTNLTNLNSRSTY